MADILYVYPQTVRVSFTNIAEQHIKQLRQSYMVDTLDIKQTYLVDKHYPIIVTHPIFWAFTHQSPVMLDLRLRELERLYKHCDMLIGFDVADSDRIAPFCAELLNEYYSSVIVPSNASKFAYIKSGVYIPIHVIPHGVDDRLLNAKPSLDKVYNFNLRLAHLYKHDKQYRYVLFFLWHSYYRKGADIVLKAMQLVQKQYPNVILLLKTGELADYYVKAFRKVKHIAIKGWLSHDELAFLYMISDVVVVPSRGGGFELNALEALAFGKPVIAHAHGCFADYAKYMITCKVKYCNTVIPHNHIHIGGGYEVDAHDLADKIIMVLNNYDEYACKYTRIAPQIRQIYSWDKIGKQLCDLFNQFLRNNSHKR